MAGSRYGNLRNDIRLGWALHLLFPKVRDFSVKDELDVPLPSSIKRTSPFDCEYSGFATTIFTHASLLSRFNLCFSNTLKAFFNSSTLNGSASLSTPAHKPNFLLDPRPLFGAMIALKSLSIAAVPPVAARLNTKNEITAHEMRTKNRRLHHFLDMVSSILPILATQG